MHNVPGKVATISKWPLSEVHCIPYHTSGMLYYVYEGCVIYIYICMSGNFDIHVVIMSINSQPHFIILSN